MQENDKVPVRYSVDPLTWEKREALSPDDVIALMLDGNQRFMTGAQVSRDMLVEQRGTVAGQYPAAISLSCIDSRTPVEIICDLGIGDTFNARIAGCVVNDDILGSMEYACAVSGARLIVILGHTACGAVKGAIDNVMLGNLTGLLSNIQPAVQGTPYEGERTASNPEFVDLVMQNHVLLMLSAVRERSQILRGMEAEGKIKIIGCMYDIQTAQITLL